MLACGLHTCAEHRKASTVAPYTELIARPLPKLRTTATKVTFPAARCHLQCQSHQGGPDKNVEQLVPVGGAHEERDVLEDEAVDHVRVPGVHSQDHPVLDQAGDVGVQMDAGLDHVSRRLIVCTQDRSFRPTAQTADGTAGRPGPAPISTSDDLLMQAPGTGFRFFQCSQWHQM